MKKFYTLLTVFFLIVSCQNNKTFDEKMTESINSYLKNNSSGDKFLAIESFNIIKEYTVKERKEKVNQSTLNAIRTMNETFPSADILSQFEQEYNFLKNQTDESSIALYEVKFKVKKETLKNNKIPVDYKALVLNDKDLNVIFFSIYKEVSYH